MPNPTALTTVSTTLLALPPRRSIAYVELLVIEIANLALYLGKDNALDKDGVRQATMAEDLADTRPLVMMRAFTAARRSCSFFPTTAELLGFYDAELRKFLDECAKDDAKQKAAAEAAFDRERREHPELYIPTAEEKESLRVMAERFAIPAERPAPRHMVQIPEPQVFACPHCGGTIPQGCADLRGLTAEDLRSMAARRESPGNAFAHPAAGDVLCAVCVAVLEPVSVIQCVLCRAMLCAAKTECRTHHAISHRLSARSQDQTAEPKARKRQKGTK